VKCLREEERIRKDRKGFVAHRTSAALALMAVGLASRDIEKGERSLLHIASMTSVEALKGGFDGGEISIT
jgi:hypothetical protein